MVSRCIVLRTIHINSLNNIIRCFIPAKFLTMHMIPLLERLRLIKAISHAYRDFNKTFDMTTIYSPIALSWFNFTFHFQSKYEPLVLEWDSKSISFKSNGSASRRYWSSYLNVYVFLGVIGFASLLIVMFNPAKDPHATDDMKVISAFLMPFLILICITETIFINFLDSILNGFHEFASLVHRLKRVTKNNNPLLKPITGPFGFQCGPSFWRHVCYIVLLGETVVLLTVFFVSFVGVNFRLDPLYISIPAVFPAITGWPSVLLGLRIYFTTNCVLEAFRLVAFYISQIVYSLELVYNLIRLLHKIDVAKYETFFLYYNAAQLSKCAFSDYFDNVAGSLMGCGFFIIVISCIGTLKFYKRLPFAIFVLFPGAFVSTLLFMFIGIPFIVHMHERSRKVVDIRIKHFAFCRNFFYLKNERLIIRRKLKCLKPITTNSGGFYALSRGAESDYLYYGALRTFDLLITAKSLGVFK